METQEDEPPSSVIMDTGGYHVRVFSPDTWQTFFFSQMLIPNVHCYSFRGHGEIRASLPARKRQSQFSLP